MNYDRENDRCIDCDKHFGCRCGVEMSYDYSDYGKNHHLVDRERPPSPDICEYCNEERYSLECKCYCSHLGELRENETLIIKCPVPNCEDEGDRVCISCKNIHDQRHNL